MAKTGNQGAHMAKTGNQGAHVANMVTGYSPPQLAVHWAVVVLVAFQYVGHNGIEAAWNAVRQQQLPPPGSEMLTYMHIGAGSAVLILALIRIVLRVTRGVPPPPAHEPWLLHVIAETVHYSIYFLLFALPLSGLAAWFLEVQLAASAHVLMKNALLAAISLHIAGALFQHFILRSDVLMRMLRPETNSAEPNETASAKSKS